MEQHCAESRKQCQKWYIQIPVEQRTAGDVVIFAGPCLLLLADIFWAGAKRHLQTTRSDVCLFPPVGIPCLPFYCCILGRVLYAPRGFAKHSISRMNYIQFLIEHVTCGSGSAYKQTAKKRRHTRWQQQTYS